MSRNYEMPVILSRDERAELFGKYIVMHNATVRETGAIYGCSKSSVHKAVTERLPEINKILADQVMNVLLHNKAKIHHVRATESTKHQAV